MINGQAASGWVKQWVKGPAYQGSDHLYTFVIDAGTTPQILTFGVGEANPAGNTGGYNIDLLAISVLPPATPTNTPTNTPNPNGATNTPTNIPSAGLAVTLDSANPTTLEAGKTAEFIATVTESGNPPAIEKLIAFTTNGGTFNPTETTTSLGDATTQLTAPAVAGTIKVQACIKDTTTCSALTTITISPKPEISFSIAPATTLEVDGTTNFTAKVMLSGTPVAKAITFATTGGTPATSNGTTSPSTGELAGTVKAPNSVPTGGKIIVSACIDGYTPAICTTQDILIKTKPIIALSVPSLGIEILKTGTIMATVTQGGSPIEVGKNVSFSILSGGGTLDSSSSAAATDANGQALATLTAPAAKGTVSIKACFDNRTDVCDTKSVTIKPQPTISLAVPASIAAGATSTNSIVATVAVDGVSTGVVRNVSFSTTGGTLSSSSGTTTDGVSNVSLTVPASKFGRITVTACVLDGNTAYATPICASKVVKVTCASASSFQADDFEDTITNLVTPASTIWSLVNNSSTTDVSFSQDSGKLKIVLPSMASQDLWTANVLAPNINQQNLTYLASTPFAFETKLTSVQGATTNSALSWGQGIIIKGTAGGATTDNLFIRFNVERKNAEPFFNLYYENNYSSSSSPKTAASATLTSYTAGTPIRLRISRTGSGTNSIPYVWKAEYSLDDGANWTSLTYIATTPMTTIGVWTVTKVGLFVLNAGSVTTTNPVTLSPAITGYFEYVTDSNSCTLLP